MTKKNIEKWLHNNMGLIVTIANSIYAKISHVHFAAIDKKDLIHSGIIGAIKAFNSYNKTKKVKLSSYVYLMAKIEMLNSLKNISCPVSITHYYLKKDGYPNLLKSDILKIIPSKIQSPDENIIKNEEKYILNKCINELDDEEKEIIIGRFFKYEKKNEIAKKLNIKYATYLRKETKILGKLARLYKKAL